MLEPRMEKLGIRGTATGRFAMRHGACRRKISWARIGKGLKVALTVLDFGRTTFGACCTGAAKTCLQLADRAREHAPAIQKNAGRLRPGEEKIARMAADVYAMEAMTAVTASLIDRGLEDYMLETAMLKVFTTDRLWEAVNDAFQIHGGSAYFTDLAARADAARCADQPDRRRQQRSAHVVHRAGRDARPGMEFKEIYDTMFNLPRGLGKAWTAGMNRPAPR